MFLMPPFYILNHAMRETSWGGEILKEALKNEHESKDNSVIDLPTVLKREQKHTKSIIDGKLYDTEKSTLICGTQDNRILFVTKEENYFSCKIEQDSYVTKKENKYFHICEFIYSDIRPEPIEYAMTNIGKYEPDKYIELFGEIE